MDGLTLLVRSNKEKSLLWIKTINSYQGPVHWVVILATSVFLIMEISWLYATIQVDPSLCSCWKTTSLKKFVVSWLMKGTQSTRKGNRVLIHTVVCSPKTTQFYLWQILGQMLFTSIPFQSKKWRLKRISRSRCQVQGQEQYATDQKKRRGCLYLVNWTIRLECSLIRKVIWSF